jgi:hypothetical protein
MQDRVETTMPIKVIDLGWCIARLEQRTSSQSPKLTIMSPSSAEERVYSPAESVVIWGDVSLLALRDALNEAYPAEEEKVKP